MAEGEDGLEPLVLDTVVRAHAPSVALGLVLAVTLALVATVGPAVATWWASGSLVVATLVVSRWLERRATRTDRALAAVLDDQ